MNKPEGFVSGECKAGNHDDCPGEVKRDNYCTCECHENWNDEEPSDG